jgi:hypothetical protein
VWVWNTRLDKLLNSSRKDTHVGNTVLVFSTRYVRSYIRYVVYPYYESIVSEVES